MFYMEFLALMWNLARFQSDTKSGRFILPTGRSGDLSKFRESPGESGRLNMYGIVHNLLGNSFTVHNKHTITFVRVGNFQFFNGISLVCSCM